jgi:hypothetical protein
LEWLKLEDKKLCQGYLQWQDPPTEFHENLPTGSKVDRGNRHRQDGDLIFLFFLQEGSRLKIWYYT